MKTLQVEGETKQGHKWKLTLGAREPKYDSPLTELPNAVFRFHTDSSDNRLVSAWQSKEALDDYLKKREINRNYLEASLGRLQTQEAEQLKFANPEHLKTLTKFYNERREGIWQSIPYSHLNQLADANICVDLPFFEELILRREKALMREYGSLPKVPQLIPIWNDGLTRGCQPALKVSFKS